MAKIDDLVVTVDISRLKKYMEEGVERMAAAAVEDSLPKDGMFNREQLDCMRSDRLPTYRSIAQVMLLALLAFEDTK